MTKKDKLEQFDSIKAELDKLQLAVYDMTVQGRFSFTHHVGVDVHNEIDSDLEGKYRVSISERAMPYYMVESRVAGKTISVSFWTESEVDDNRENANGFWRVMRHAQWKIKQAQKSGA